LSGGLSLCCGKAFHARARNQPPTPHGPAFGMWVSAGNQEYGTALGEEAHLMTTPGFGTGLSVMKGGFVFKVRVYGFVADQVKAKEKILAEEILAKL